MNFNRRSFITSGAAIGGAALVPGLAASAFGATKPAYTTLSPAQALAKLMTGNKRFAAGNSTVFAHTSRLPSLALGQAPWAMVLSCSDSRLSPEIIFDQSLGDLFIVRIAGNYADPGGIGSLEYAVAHFKCPILLVVGHSSCGAVHATVDNIKAGSPPVPGNIADVVRAIAPAAKAVLHKPGDVYANAIAENVRENVAHLKAISPVIGPAITSGALEVAGGVYDLKTGRVNLL